MVFPGPMVRAVTGLVVWGVAIAASARPLGSEDARYFLTRIGFAPSSSEVSAYEKLTRQQAIEKILVAQNQLLQLDNATAKAVVAAPSWVNQPLIPFRQFKDKSDEEKKSHREREIRQGFDLRGWWLREMLSTPSPLTKRMTLFWHNHFVSSQQKVKYSQLMYR